MALLPVCPTVLHTVRSQVELRVLAHLCGDTRLCSLLRSGDAGAAGGDVFQLIAASWLRPGTGGLGPQGCCPVARGAASPATAATAGRQTQASAHAHRLAVSPEDREVAKRVTYGIIYGLSPWGLQASEGQRLVSCCC
jgi:hypothetical protein